jgi:hypothetical protein
MESVSLLLLWMAQLWQSGLKMASWAGPRRCWATTIGRALLVIQILRDLSPPAQAMTVMWCWGTGTPDGKCLFATALDGTIVAVRFEDGELGWATEMEDRHLQT